MSNNRAQENQPQPDRPNTQDVSPQHTSQHGMQSTPPTHSYRPVEAPFPASGGWQCDCLHLLDCTGKPRWVPDPTFRYNLVRAGRRRPCGCFHLPSCLVDTVSVGDIPRYQPVARMPRPPNLLDFIDAQYSRLSLGGVAPGGRGRVPGVAEAEMIQSFRSTQPEESAQTVSNTVQSEPEETDTQDSQPTDESVERESSVTPRPPAQDPPAQTRSPASSPETVIHRPESPRCPVGIGRGWRLDSDLERSKRGWWS